MTDIVERLRHHCGQYEGSSKYCGEAADEIERLRVETWHQPRISDLRAEIERLQEELADVRADAALLREEIKGQSR